MKKGDQALRAGGFTLVELLVSLMLGLLVTAVIVSFNRFQLFTLQNQAVQLDVQSTARAITEIIAREVRRAGLNAKPPHCGLTQARWDLVRFKADHNNDGSMNGLNEDVSYRYDATRKAIERVDNVTGRVDVLVEGWETALLRLQYFDGNGTEIIGALGNEGLAPAERTAVRRIRVTVSLAEDALDPSNSQNVGARAATNIDLRNRFFAGERTNPQVCL